ncbi:hypothetical protein JMJ77_0007398 [Colletotrichum scovillei]|uniref:Mid2 domain-containing protein n=1 Tax=Colletotrichum scovillei TaxID=1209932 RepID=A0A9P7REG7_9PEZI|nr:hypothetical protein JMJ77_0007398 [Colletotrichum scovillei]KAG7074371.1 hypothetical protein JMJ76_0010852 [Colletotrichum scovillei]KAG7081236.1 hypothetical protein JMJ78_0003362 [Colletotrichum scovillei]
MNIFSFLVVLSLARNAFAADNTNTKFTYPVKPAGLQGPTFVSGQNVVFNWTTDADKLNLLLWTNQNNDSITLGKGISSKSFTWTVDFYAFSKTDPPSDTYYFLGLFVDGSTSSSDQSSRFFITLPDGSESGSTSTSTLLTPSPTSDSASTTSSESSSATAASVTSTSGSSTEGLGAGAIAGIVIGAILGVGLSVCAGILLARRRYRGNGDLGDQGNSQGEIHVSPKIAADAKYHSPPVQEAPGDGNVSRSPPPVELG